MISPVKISEENSLLGFGSVDLTRRERHENYYAHEEPLATTFRQEMRRVTVRRRLKPSDGAPNRVHVLCLGRTPARIHRHNDIHGKPSRIRIYSTIKVQPLAPE